MSLDPASFFTSLLVSSVGFVLFEYGRRMKRPPQLSVGLILLIFPYFVASVWAMLGIAVLLVAALWLALMRGL